MIRTPVSNLHDFFSFPHSHSHHRTWYVHVNIMYLCSRHIFDLKICPYASWEPVAFWALKTLDPMNPVPQGSMLAIRLTVHCTRTGNLCILDVLHYVTSCISCNVATCASLSPLTTIASLRCLRLTPRATIASLPATGKGCVAVLLLPTRDGPATVSSSSCARRFCRGSVFALERRCCRGDRVLARFLQHLRKPKLDDGQPLCKVLDRASELGMRRLVRVHERSKVKWPQWRTHEWVRG